MSLSEVPREAGRRDLGSIEVTFILFLSTHLDPWGVYVEWRSPGQASTGVVNPGGVIRPALNIAFDRGRCAPSKVVNLGVQYVSLKLAKRRDPARD